MFQTWSNTRQASVGPLVKICADILRSALHTDWLERRLHRLVRVSDRHHALLLVGVVQLRLLLLRLHGWTAVAEAVLVLAVVQGAANADHRCVEVRIAVTAMLLHFDGRRDMATCSISIAILVLLTCLRIVHVCFAAWACYIGCPVRIL